MDKYGAVVDIVNKEHEGTHERLMTFVNKAAERVLGPVPAKLGQRTAAKRRRPEPPDSGQAEASAAPKNLETNSLGLGAL